MIGTIRAKHFRDYLNRHTLLPALMPDIGKAVEIAVS
jgi:hypothetical protein